MNTKEMLIEVIDKGGMFIKHGKMDSYIVSYDPSAGVFVANPGGEFVCTVSMNRVFMAATWELYIKPVDWSKVPIDTKVLVKSFKEYAWEKRHFAGCEKGYPQVWDDGGTSWSCEPYETHAMDEIKLAE